MDFFNAFNHTNFDANGIQGVGNQAGFYYNGGGVYCGSANASGLYQPCSPTNNVISAYGNPANWRLPTAFLDRPTQSSRPANCNME